MSTTTPLVRRGLAELLGHESDLEVVGEAATEREALIRIDVLRPDIAIVDISLPDGDGRDLIKKIRKKHPEVKVLVSSMHDEALYAKAVLKAGALGYVNKQDDPSTLVEAVRHAVAGQDLSPSAHEGVVQKARGIARWIQAEDTCQVVRRPGSLPMQFSRRRH